MNKTTQIAVNFLLTVLITYLFLLIMMTAAAQQRAAALLEPLTSNEPVKMDLTTAWAKVRAAEETRAEIVGLIKSRNEENQKILKGSEDFGRLIAELDEVWSDFAAAANRVRSTTDCPVPDTALVDFNLRAQGWNNFAACVSVEAVPEGDRENLLSVLKANRTVKVVVSDLKQVIQRMETAKRNHLAIEERLGAANAAIAGVDKIAPAFTEMKDMQKPGLGLFINAPPSVMQVLLAFGSGVFGALLVTLVLVVYPKNEISLMATPASSSRLLLGGLISLGVYIVLGGGAAVLGNATPFDQTKANYMTFCAIGVLAGMFSDRVAAWLSDRANTFFGARPAADSTLPPDGGPPPPSGAGGGEDPAFG